MILVADVLDEFCKERLKVNRAEKKGQDPFKELRLLPQTSSTKEVAEGGLTQPAETNDSLRETL